MITRRFQFIDPARPYRELQILTRIGERPDVSQRSLAEAALLGPTMVNRYITEMQERGLIEVEGETNRSFHYRLTSAGEYRCEELFFQASKEIVQFYGLVKLEFHRRLCDHAESGAKKIVLFGAAETAEIVVAASEDSGLEIVGVVDNDSLKWGRRIGGIPVSPPDAIRELGADTVLITSFGHADEIQSQIEHLEKEGVRVTRV